MDPYRTPVRPTVAREPEPTPREEWRSTAALMMVAAVPLVGAVCGIAFSDRELMIGVLGFVLSLSILGSRARSGGRAAFEVERDEALEAGSGQCPSRYRPPPEGST